MRKRTEDYRLRAEQLEQQLRLALAEVAALKVARDLALKISVWGGLRPRAESGDRS